MTININTNIEEELKKCDELIAKYEQLEEHAKQIHFVTIREFAEMRGCSIKVAQQIFCLDDFPSENFGKEKVISLEALRNWYLVRHNKSDY